VEARIYQLDDMRLRSGMPTPTGMFSPLHAALVGSAICLGATLSLVEMMAGVGLFHQKLWLEDCSR